ncbi:MAG: MFS transporter [Spirochaetales bacterium]|nr:MFS transporter [Spirochaetales bacterium]
MDKPVLDRKRTLLYSLGDLSAAIPLTVLSFYQLYFLTDVARLAPSVASWSIVFVKLWDAVNDPLLGAWSDRLRSPHGRRRWPMVLAAVPLGLSFSLLWVVPPFGQVGVAVWYTLAFIVFDTCFTVFHVSFNALTPALAGDYDERSSLNGYRMAFSISGTLGAIIVMTLLAGVISDPATRFAVAGAGLGLFCVVPPFLAYRASAGFDEESSPTPLSSPDEKRVRRQPLRAALFESARAVLANRPFRQVMGLYLFSWTATAVISSALVYFVSYYMAEPGHANYLVLVAEVAAIAFIPLVVAAAKRWDKRRAFIAGCVTWILVQASIARIAPDQLGFAYALAVMIGLGIATAYVLPWSMIPDAIEQDTAATGIAREGSYYAFASFFQKLGTGAALWLMARAMDSGGYVTPTADTPFPVQPAGAIASIRVFMGVVPVVLLTVAILFAIRYPVSREDQRSAREAILARNRD